MRERGSLHRRLARLGALCGIASTLSAVPSARGEAQPRGSLSGVVRDSLSGGIAGAEVSIDGTSLRVTTDARGGFRMPTLPAGKGVASVRRLGFVPTSATFDVPTSGGVSIEVRLAAIAQRLSPVVVRDRLEATDSRLAGFNARRVRSAGHFITRERIDRVNSFSFTDLLREIPGVRIGRTRNSSKSVRLRGANCPPLVFIDGSPASAAEFDLESIDLAMVEGVEVYSGSSNVPPELMGPRTLFRCGVVAVWSRPARPKPRRTRERRAAINLDSLLATQQVYTDQQVDAVATPIEGVVPPYPDSLWAAAVGGRVVAEFVVGVDGRVEPATVGIVSSSSPAFSDAVRRALEEAEFAPARAGGRAVRQLVQLPFEFSAPTQKPGVPGTSQ